MGCVSYSGWAQKKTGLLTEPGLFLDSSVRRATQGSLTVPLFRSVRQTLVGLRGRGFLSRGSLRGGLRGFSGRGFRTGAARGNRGAASRGRIAARSRFATAATGLQASEQTLTAAARIGLAARRSRGRLTAGRLSTAAAVAETREQTTTAAASVRARRSRSRLAARSRFAAATAAETREQTTTAATTTTMTAQTGNGRALLTANKGDADDREEHRDAEH